MKITRKRILSALLTLLMVITIVPFGTVLTHAADINSVTINGANLGSYPVSYKITYTKSRPSNSQMTYNFTISAALGHSSSYIYNGHALQCTITVNGTSSSVQIKANTNDNWTGTTPREKKVSVTCASTTGNATQTVRFRVTSNGTETITAGTVDNSSYSVTSSALLTDAVTFDKQGGTGGSNSVTATRGANMPSATMPTRTGYTFAGYYDATSGGTQYYTAAGASARIWNKTSATTLYARWTANTLSVSYHANGGAVTSDTYKLSSSLMFLIADNSRYIQSWTYNNAKTNGLTNASTFGLARTGYSFAGWGTTSSGGTIFDQNDATLTPLKINSNLASQNSSSTLYAAWTPNTYTLSYAAGGGSGTMAAQKATYDSNLQTRVNTFTRTGYVFNKWQASGGSTGTFANSYLFSPWKLTGNTTFTATWTANPYSVSYNSNKTSTASTTMSGTMANSSHTYDTAKNLTSNAFTLPGYQFQGWATTAAGAVAYSNSASVKNLTSTSGAVYPLYAKWTPNAYNVKYNANNGSGTMANSVHTYDTARNLTVNAFARTGYTYQGWATSATGAVAYANSASVKNLTATNNATYNLYANWKANTYTVRYDKNAADATGTTMANSTFTYDTYAYLRKGTYSRYGYHFVGWSTSPTATTANYADEQEVRNLSSGAEVVLYAVWSQSKMYSVTYDANGGTGAPSGTSIPESNKNMTISSTRPTRTGYTFRGWALKREETIQMNWRPPGSAYTVEGNTVFYAQWTPNRYSVKYDKNATDALGSMANTNHSYDVAQNLSSNLYTRTGYTFQGWATTATGAVVYGNLASVKNLSAADGATVTLYAVWKPITYCVAFDPNGGEGAMLDQEFTYDAQLALRANTFTRTGYNFSGWATSAAGAVVHANNTSVKNLTATNGAVYTLYAKWSPRNNMKYVVEHYLQQLDGTYANSANDSFEFFDGTTDANKTISPLSYEGFTYNSAAENATGLTLNITANESTVFQLYYERDQYTLTVNPDNGESAYTKKLMWGASEVLDQPEKQGYAFAGWTKISGSGENISGDVVTIGKSHLTVKAQWAAVKNIYTIEFIYEDALGEFTDGETKLGDDCVTAELKQIVAPLVDFYVYDSTNPLNITQQTIAANGTTVFRLYYKRQTVNLFIDPDNDQAPYDVSARWGSSVQLAIPEKEGYSFAGWGILSGDAVSDSSRVRLGKSDAEIQAQWAATENTYTIAYYYEDGNGNFVFDHTIIMTDGITDESMTIEPTEQDADFMLFDAGNPGNLLTQTIAPDGSTLFRLYYVRNRYSLSVNSNGGLNGPSNQTNLRWGAKITLSPVPARTGYRFTGWTVSGTGASVNGNIVTIGTANTTVTANWTPNTDTAYRVNSYLQNADGTYPANANSTTLHNDGVTDADKLISASPQERYVYDGTADGSTGLRVKILPDGSTVFKLYYKRDAFRLTIDRNGGTGGSSSQTDLNWGKTVALEPPTPPVGRQFAGWQSSDSSVSITGNTFIMPYANITITASWSTLTCNISYNANGGQNAPAAQTKTYGVPLQLRTASPSRDGYVFNGWAESSSATQAIYKAGDTYSKEAGATLYAVWSRRGLIRNDIYSFSNSPSNFGDRYNILNDDFDKLTTYVKRLYGPIGAGPIVIDLGINRFSEWGGSCYGMASTVLLHKSGQVNMRNFASGTTLWDFVPPKSNAALESAVNYYMISQNIPHLRPTNNKSGTSEFSNGLQQIVNDAKAGKSTFFCYYFSQNGKQVGHAIVIVGYKDSFDGVHTLLAYDNRYPNRDTNIVISANYDTCAVDGDVRENVSGFEAITNMSRFDAIDIDGPNNVKNYVIPQSSQTQSVAGTEIRFQATPDDLTITNANGQSLIYDAETGDVSGNMQILRSSFLVNSTADGSSAPVTFVYEVANSNQFQFDAQQPGLDVTVVGNGLYASAAASNANQVIIGGDMGVSVKGNGFYDCKLSLGVDNGHCDALQMNATADKTASLKFAGAKIIASADYRQAGSLTIFSDTTSIETKPLPKTDAEYYEISWDAAGTTIIKPANGETIANSITGPTNMSLNAGYAATSTDSYTITGEPAPTVTKVSGDAKISWNNTSKKLDIAAGLAAGTYPVTLKASNGVAPDVTLTFTLTVNAVTPARGIFGTNPKWYGAWWHYLLFFFCFGFIWMWF